MKEEMVRETICRLLTEIVRLKFKDQYNKHRQMEPELQDELVLEKVAEVEAMVCPLVGADEARQMVLDAIEEAREYRTT